MLAIGLAVFISRGSNMSEFAVAGAGAPVDDTPTPENLTSVDIVVGTPIPDVPEEPQTYSDIIPVNPVRAAAGRLGAKRRQQLIEFGKQYELDQNLTPGRQRLKQLIQLGKRYEQEHGLKAAKPRRKSKGDAWAEFLSALARVTKPAYRPAVESLATKLAEGDLNEGSSKTAA
jgi:hypothetical protein